MAEGSNDGPVQEGAPGVRARLPHDITDLSRTVSSIAADRPDTQVNRLLYGAFESLYAEARRAGVPEHEVAESWTPERPPTYADLAPVLAALTREPAIAPHRPSGKPGEGAKREAGSG
jgi:hypothetical protein